MTADLEPPMSGAGRSARRPRRSVITDDSYGEGGYLERPSSDRVASPGAEAPRGRKVNLPAERARRPRRESKKSAKPARKPRSGAGAIWRLAAVATLLWVGGVAAFAAGFLRLPLTTLDAFSAALAATPAHMLLMTGAVALAPLGLIWLTAMSARRSVDLREETARLASRVRAMSDERGRSGEEAPSGGLDPEKLRDETEAATRAFGALEASFEAVEERADRARSRLEAERAALAELLKEIERNASGIAGALTDARREASSAPPREARLRPGFDAQRPPASPTSEAVGLEPKTMLAGALPAPKPSYGGASVPPPPAGSDPDFDDDDEFGDEEGDEFAPALGPERAAGEPPKAEPRRGGNGQGRERSADPSEEFRRRVEAVRPSGGGGSGGGAAAGAAAAAAAAAPDPAAAGGPRLDWNKLVTAANFPESEEDSETLDALYSVLTDAEAAALLQSAEDALTELAEAGLYMEDMQPHHAPTELWRSYIVEGKRRDVMDLGGVRDPDAIEDVTEALRSKPDFSATTERFLDRYETVVERLFAEAPTPTMVVELADTRSGRAYMLLARASGRFG